ncbi:unnamed protein product, partial [Mesorhabditis belari]|uniref:Uncharacterized protein n=1 Tax=Mesorhabditis belari TaxID=2138241 RepID=A0A915FR41_9BILA
MLQKEDRVDVFDNDLLNSSFNRQVFSLNSTPPQKFRGHEARLFQGKLCFNREFGIPLSVPAWKTINLYEADTYGPTDLLQHEETIPPKLLHFANKRWLMMIKEHGIRGETYWLMFPCTEEWVTCIRNASIYRGGTSPQIGYSPSQASRVLPSAPQLPPQPPQPPPRPTGLIDANSDRNEQNSYFTSPSIPMPEPQRPQDFRPPNTDVAQNRENNVFLRLPPPPLPSQRSPRSQSSQNNSNQGNRLGPIAVGLGTAVVGRVIGGMLESALESALGDGVVN